MGSGGGAAPGILTPGTNGIGPWIIVGGGESAGTSAGGTGGGAPG